MLYRILRFILPIQFSEEPYFWIIAKNRIGSSPLSIPPATGQSGIRVTSVALNKSAATFLVGSRETLTATCSPANATFPDVTWTTNNANATVSSGTVTGVAAGTPATITATSMDGSLKTATFIATTKAYADNTAGPAGGILFYDKGNYDGGWRFMEAASANVNGTWYNGTSINILGAKGSDYGNGKTNTEAIVAAQGVGSYMAFLCYEFSQGGYADWFMPSYNESDKLITVYPACKTDVGSFYSSTQQVAPSYYCWAYNVTDSAWRVSFIHMTFATRPIRQF